MNKDMTIKVTFCEHRHCTGMVGYAGALVENPSTHQRKMVCLPDLERWYAGWRVLLKWRNPGDS